MTDTFELPSGLPEGPYEACQGDASLMWYVEDKDGRVIAQFCENEALARAIASIPAREKEIGELKSNVHDKAHRIAVQAHQIDEKQAELDRLRAQNAELRELLEPISKIPLWRDSYPDGPDQTVGEIGGYQTTIKITPDQVRKARAILAETEAAP